MADLILTDGREVAFDLSKMTYGQWLGLFDPRESDGKSAETLARVSGMTAKELKALPFPEWKRLFAALLKKTREPVTDDPNSQSASSSA
jgi:hypothetical protein